MRSKLAYLLFGTAIGAGGHYGYRYYNPERNINSATQEMVASYVSHHNLEQGYLVSVLKSVGLMLKGFYHYGMDTKIRGFNYNSTYLRKDEVSNPDSTINHLYCIFSPTEFICGHPEIQHGGATATIIDQNMGYLAILHSKENVATGDLSIKYKRPIKKDQYYVFEGRVTERAGRKIWIKGTIKELQTGEIKVESEGLFFTVNWDNQMSRIITKFFQTINFKDYAEQHQPGANIHRDYKQSQSQVSHSHHEKKEHHKHKVEASSPPVNRQAGTGKRQRKLEEIKALKQELLNRDRKNKEYDERIEKLTALVEELEKKQNLHLIPPVQNIGSQSVPHTGNVKAEYIS